jgi:hypothetical protein
MTDQMDQYDIQFVQLVMSLHIAAMQQMGKVASPLTGKIERDMAMCRNTIDMLEMLQRKTAGNVTDEEQKLVDRLLYECRLNYMDEIKKDQAAAAEPQKDVGTAKQEPDSPPLDTPKAE